MKNVFIGIITAAISFWLPGNAQSVPGVRIEQADLTRISIFDLVHLLRSRGVNVSFVDLDSAWADRETAGSRLQELQALPEAERTPRERALLKALTEDSSGSPEQSAKYVIGPKYCRATLELKELILNTGLFSENWTEIVGKAFPDFAIWRSNTSFIVEPKSDREKPTKVTFECKDLSIQEAMAKLQKEILAPLGIRLTEITQGSSAPAFAESFGADLLPITLDVKNEPLPILLARFSEALSPDVCWTLAGERGRRSLRFARLPKEK